MNFNADGPCGTQQTTGCPAIQCWTFTPSVANGTNFIYVDYSPANDVPSEFDFDFTTYDRPPHTALQTPPDPNDTFTGLQSVERPMFTVEAPGELLPVSFRCSLSTSASRPGLWGVVPARRCPPGAQP
jgi:hypothetical protein